MSRNNAQPVKPTSSPGLGPALAVFAAAYAVALIATGVIASVAQLQSGTGLSALALLGAALVAGQTFATTAQRRPTPRERNLLSLYSLVLSLALSFVFGLIAILASEGSAGLHAFVSLFSSLPALVWLMIVSLTALLSFLVLLLGYGWLTSRLYAHRIKTEKT